jgi:hypothetical protein
MIPKECKQPAEVDFPVADVSRHSAREKSIRHGHPSTLHFWWARRLPAACRATLNGVAASRPLRHALRRRPQRRSPSVGHAQGPVEGFTEDSNWPDRSVTLGHRVD